MREPAVSGAAGVLRQLAFGLLGTCQQGLLTACSRAGTVVEASLHVVFTGEVQQQQCSIAGNLTFDVAGTGTGSGSGYGNTGNTGNTGNQGGGHGIAGMIPGTNANKVWTHSLLQVCVSLLCLASPQCACRAVGLTWLHFCLHLHPDICHDMPLQSLWAPGLTVWPVAGEEDGAGPLLEAAAFCSALELLN